MHQRRAAFQWSWRLFDYAVDGAHTRQANANWLIYLLDGRPGHRISRRAGRDYPVDMADAHPPSDAAAESPDCIGAALRTLRPIEEKVVRLSYGIGCQRAHSAAEIAAEFGVGAELVEGIREEAERRLAERGVPRDQVQQAGQPLRRSGNRCGNPNAASKTET